MKLFARAFFGVVLCSALSGCVMWDDTGLWSGPASLQDANGSGTCSLDVDLSHDETSATVHHISSDCSDPALNWSPGTFQVSNDNTLWQHGRSIGWAHEDGSVMIDSRDPANDFEGGFPRPADRVVISWSVVGGNLQFTEDVYFAGQVQHASAWLQRE